MCHSSWFSRNAIAFCVFIFLGCCPPLFATVAIDFTLSGTLTNQSVYVTGGGSADRSTGLMSQDYNLVQGPQELLTLPYFPAALATACCEPVAIGSALNLFQLTGGNYAFTRHTTWSNQPGVAVDVSGSVTTTQTLKTVNATITGNYVAPSDVVGLSDYTQQWTWSGVGTAIDYTGSALAQESSGNTFSINYSGTYSVGGLLLPSPELMSVSLLNLSGTGTTASYQYATSVALVPEPSVSLGVLCLLALAAPARRRNPVIGFKSK
jgi:hypothetical protein